MEFHTLKRRDLQVLCKKNNIPANTTNAAMADALSSLDLVEGIEELLGQTDMSPERSVITSPNIPRTSTRQRVRIGESECSKLATRIRCSTRRNAVAGTDSKQTPATRTSRRTTRKIQHDIQAEYEASLDESEVSVNKELLSNECESVEESKLSGVVNQDDNVSSENQFESQGQSYDQEEVVNEAQEALPSEMINVNLKVDFRSLSRKHLQNLCKRNKIPANITNAAMIDALEALESVEGLDDLLKESDPLGVKSPEMSRMTSYRARQSRTAQKTTRLKPSQTRSALGKMSVPKKDDFVVQSLANKMDSTMEDIESSVSISTAEDVLSKEVENVEQNHHEALPEKLDGLDCVFENDGDLRAESKSISEKSSDGSETCIVEGTPNEPLDDVVDESSSPTIIVSCDYALVHTEENPLSKINNTSEEDALETYGDDQEFEANKLLEVAANNESLESNTALLDHPNSDEGESQLHSDEVLDESDASIMVENIKELQDEVTENEAEGENESFETEEVQKTADVFAEEEFILSEPFIEKPTVNEGDDREILNQVGDRVDETNVVEVVGDVESVEGSKSISNSTTQDEDPSLDSDSNANESEVEKLKGSCADGQTTEKLCSDLTCKAAELAPKPKGTPLNHKSLRKLKQMLKDKLQTTTLLTSKMENLTLEEKDVEPVQEVCQNLKEECDEIDTSCVVSTLVSGIAKAPLPAVVTDDDKDEVDEKSTQIIVDKAVNDPIVDDAPPIQICAESVNTNSTLKLESEKQTSELMIPVQEVGIIESDTCLQFTPSKSLRKTPSKCSSKKTMSGGRKNDAVDMINKENIDKSATKTGPGKTEMAVFGKGILLSPISMRKLKKELQQQSEKKRIALQSRSENQCPLSSP